jgi:hypothetical protein
MKVILGHGLVDGLGEVLYGWLSPWLAVLSRLSGCIHWASIAGIGWPASAALHKAVDHAPDFVKLFSLRQGVANENGTGAAQVLGHGFHLGRPGHEALLAAR